MNSEEVKEMADTAVNLIFIGAVLFVALLFLGLRGNYANTLVSRAQAEERITQENKFSEYNFASVSGLDVIGAISAYSKKTPMLITGAYNFVDGETFTDILYDKDTSPSVTALTTVSTSLDPRMDAGSMQAIFRKESVYFSIITYDSDTPADLLRDLGIGTIQGRNIKKSTIEEKAAWLRTQYSLVRPGGAGYTVSGVLFVLIDLDGVAPDSAKYKAVSLYSE